MTKNTAKHTAENLTAEIVEKLMKEADAHNDDVLVSMCDSVLSAIAEDGAANPDSKATKGVLWALDNAAAQE